MTTPSIRTLFVWALFAAFLVTLLPAGDVLTPVIAADEAFAEDDGAKPPDEDDEEDPDLGDKHVPFADQVNMAIERGVNWLLAKPELFRIPGAKDEVEDGAFYGPIKGKHLYGGGTGKQYTHPAGSTALALYTLLKCGVDPKHPIITQGFNWIKYKHTITEKYDGNDGQGFKWRLTQSVGSYELSAMILALTAKWDPHKKSAKSKARARKGKLRIKDADDKEWLHELVEALVSRRGEPEPDGARKDQLGWRYNRKKLTLGGSKRRMTFGGGAMPPNANQDLSSTQLAALALFSAHRFGVKIDAQVWLDIVEFTMGNQQEKGPKVKRHVAGYSAGGYATPTDFARGFCYILGSKDHSEGNFTGAMTCCGVANLLMAREFLANDRKARKKFLAGDLPKKIDTAINDGIAWLDYNWSSFRNRNGSGYPVYYLYGLERCMDMRGTQLVGKRAWYPAGAKELLKIQNKVDAVDVPKMKKGTESKPGVFWKTNTTHEPCDVLDTCFALLFLKRATFGMIPPPSVVVTGD